MSRKTKIARVPLEFENTLTEIKTTFDIESTTEAWRIAEKYCRFGLEKSKKKKINDLQWGW